MHEDAPDTLNALIGLGFIRVDYDRENENKPGGEKTVEIKESMLGWFVKSVSQELD
jgi:hypothetical protein